MNGVEVLLPARRDGCAPDQLLAIRPHRSISEYVSDAARR